MKKLSIFTSYKSIFSFKPWLEKLMVSLTVSVEEIIGKKQLNDFSIKEDQLFIKKIVKNDFKKVEILMIFSMMLSHQ